MRPASPPTLIQDTASLNQFCNSLVFDKNYPPFLALDTEFIRERTYFPILCLIQVADAEKAAAIDPCAPGIDLAPFWQLLARSDFTKVFHACRQDIEIFRQVTGRIPEPLFDTQLAAMVCGFGEAVSYETLVRDVLHQHLDKTSRFSDWSSRPLRQEQLTYALGDVIYLRDLYRWFLKELEKNKRWTWLQDEMAVLLKPETYESNKGELWKKIKHRQVQSLNATSLTFLQALCRWREELAQQRNLPRRHVLKDELLVELAILKPTQPSDLKRLRDPQGSAMLKSVSTEELFELAKQSQTAPQLVVAKPFKQKLSPQQSQLLEFFKLLLKICAENAGVASKLIASIEDLERLAKEEAPEILALQGWRYELFGKEALAFKAGKRGLAYLQGKLQRYPLDKGS